MKFDFQRSQELVEEEHRVPSSATLPSSSVKSLVTNLSRHSFFSALFFLSKDPSFSFLTLMEGFGAGKKGLAPGEKKNRGKKFSGVALFCASARLAWLELRGPRRRYYDAPPF